MAMLNSKIAKAQNAAQTNQPKKINYLLTILHPCG